MLPSPIRTIANWVEHLDYDTNIIPSRLYLYYTAKVSHTIVLIAYGASLLTTLVPAWQATRIVPAEALRYQ